MLKMWTFGCCLPRPFTWRWSMPSWIWKVLVNYWLKPLKFRCDQIFLVKSIIASCYATNKLCTNGDMTKRMFLAMSCLKKKVRFHLCVNESRRLCVLSKLLQDAPNAPQLDLSVMDVPMVVFEKVCFHYSKCLVVKETYRWNNLEPIGMKVVWLVSIVCQRRE